MENLIIWNPTFFTPPQEISFDVFLQVVWVDGRLNISSNHSKHYIELTQLQREEIWVPDLYIRQLREMKILKVFEEISSLRIYENSTISLSIGATIIIKCDMDFVLYPLDVQFCPVDFSSCELDICWHKSRQTFRHELFPCQISTARMRWSFTGAKIIRSHFQMTLARMAFVCPSMSSPSSPTIDPLKWTLVNVHWMTNLTFLNNCVASLCHTQNFNQNNFSLSSLFRHASND